MLVCRILSALPRPKMRQRWDFLATMLTDVVLPLPFARTLCPVWTRTIAGPRPFL